MPDYLSVDDWLATLPDDQHTEITDDHDGEYHCAECAEV